MTEHSRTTGRTPRSVSDITQENVRTMRRLEELAGRQRSFADRVAEVVARFGGSIAFVWVHVLLFAAWLTWNTWPGLPHFDPYPYVFLTLCVSLEAIFLASFILISQNYEMRVSERRSQLDLQINLLSEQENTKMLQLLEAIAIKVGAATQKDPEIQALAQATHPDTLARQIEHEFHQQARSPGHHAKPK